MCIPMFVTLIAGTGAAEAAALAEGSALAGGAGSAEAAAVADVVAGVAAAALVEVEAAAVTAGGAVVEADDVDASEGPAAGVEHAASAAVSGSRKGRRIKGRGALPQPSTGEDRRERGAVLSLVASAGPCS
jgi:hypothetical protein